MLRALMPHPTHDLAGVSRYASRGGKKPGENAMPTLEGGCLCGAVRYRSDAEPVMQVVCHCEPCRKNSGSGFSMNVAVAPRRLRIESGSARRYEDQRLASAHASQRLVCGDCGAHEDRHGPASEA